MVLVLWPRRLASLQRSSVTGGWRFAGRARTGCSSKTIDDASGPTTTARTWAVQPWPGSRRTTDTRWLSCASSRTMTG